MVNGHLWRALAVSHVLSCRAVLQLVAVEGGTDWDAAWAQAPIGQHIAATSYHGGYANSGPGGLPQSPAEYTQQVSGLQLLSIKPFLKYIIYSLVFRQRYPPMTSCLGWWICAVYSTLWARGPWQFRATSGAWARRGWSPSLMCVRTLASSILCSASSALHKGIT